MREQAGWHWRRLLDSPHRLGFFLAMVVLGASALWWAAVQLARSGALGAMPMAVSPSLVHAAVMTFGFFPLFFCGFVFTAGPRWLHVRGPAARELVPAFAAQAAGWLVWLAGSGLDALLAVAGLVLAGSGLLRATLLLVRLVRSSSDEDRVHPVVIAAALGFGSCCILASAAALAFGAPDVARRCVLSGLWGCVAVVFVTAGHRMIPFFQPAPETVLQARGDWAQLALLVGIAALEAIAVWLEQVPARPWHLAQAAVELAVGSTLLWGAVRWAIVKKLGQRLLRMMHTGLAWIALAFALQGATSIAALVTGSRWLPLAPLHALTMGGLGSLMLAMVTRVSAGHAGIPVAADRLVWALFWLLQVATVLRIAASVPGATSQPLLTAAAVLWAGLMAAWAVRYGSTYGRPPAAPRQR